MNTEQLSCAPNPKDGGLKFPRLLSTIAVLSIIAIQPATTSASIIIDFEGLDLGLLSRGDVLKSVGAFEATVGNQIGTIKDDPVSIDGGFSGNYLSSEGGQARRVNIDFSPSISSFTVDANYQDNGSSDFRILAKIDGNFIDVLPEINDGPNTQNFSVTLSGPASILGFRDNDLSPVQIDNLRVVPVPEPASLLMFCTGSCVIAFGGGFRSRCRRK